MRALLRSAAICACLLNVALAVTPVDGESMSKMVKAGGANLALAAQPMWFFSRAKGNPSCYPTSAIDAHGSQKPAAPLCAYPDTGCGCRQAGVKVGRPGPRFPVYYSFKQCNETELRVAYNLFYEKDGCSPEGLAGHPYDWERAIVVWGKGGDTKWVPSQLMLSQHNGYQTLSWGEIKNTFKTGDGKRARGGKDGHRNRDHAKVYVSWSKHAQYDTRKTGWYDLLSQVTGLAYRSDDWWYFPVKGDYVLADPSTKIGQKIAGFEWGFAESFPGKVHEGLCEAT
ncbi:hypothetical protein B0T16DRAFT_315062 [Cercophora newfieldiana]|uniref:Necrosis inducing protein (NPP1) n=1 Tax=Cercophora newfieldiana TaxID=92897 RepID=A0AA40D239_9PEZI|nr:hypothetical protein B0T16DRAFT_315062 [Cercophora newfieldiana]